MRLAKVKAVIMMQMEVPDGTPSGIPKTIDECEKINIVRKAVLGKINEKNVEVAVYSVEEDK